MNKIQVTDYYVQIIADSNDEDFLRLLEEDGGIFKMRSKNTYRCSLHKLPEVLKVLRNIDSVDALYEKGFSGSLCYIYEQEIQRRERTRLLKELGPDNDSKELWRHQQLGVELAQVNKRYNFFYDTRTGKTRMAYQIMQNALMAGTAKRCLVIVRSAIIQSWLSDAKEFPALKVVAYYKNDKQKQQALHSPSHIILWSTGMFVDSLELLKSLNFDMCFFDESSDLKNHRSKTSKAAKELGMCIPSWYNLSATPAPNNESEYYTQMQIVDPYCFNPARTYFVSKYFDNVSRNENYEKLRIRSDMKQAFMQIVEDSSIFVDQNVMPTAGKEWHTISYELSDTLQNAYSTMCSNMYVDIEGIEITASMAAALRAKLSQLTSGFIMDTDAIKDNKVMRKLGLNDEKKQEIHVLDEQNRLSVLQTILQKIGDTKVVIWTNYTEEFNSIRTILGENAKYIRGGCPTKDKEEAINLFKNGSLQYLVCHPLSIGMGINLTEAYNVIYYSLTDSWEALKQSSERTCGHINVQPNKCHYWVIQANSTVDEIIYKNVMNKCDSTTAFLNHLKAVALQ